MKYYKYINIPNIETLQEKIIKAIPKELLEAPSVTFLNRFVPELYNTMCSIPELNEYLESIGLRKYLTDLTLYVMDSESKFYIHTDPPSAGLNSVRILLPLQGCNDTYTQFYESDIEPTTEYIYPKIGEPQPFIRYKEEDCTLVDQANLSKPYFINTRSIHGIYNPNKVQRISMWINFTDEIDLYSQM